MPSKLMWISRIINFNITFGPKVLAILCTLHKVVQQIQLQIDTQDISIYSIPFQENDLS